MSYSKPLSCQQLKFRATTSYSRNGRLSVTKNPTRSKAGGLPVLTIPLILFCDDTSGNKSKKWNKFIEWSMILAGISMESVK